MVAIERDIFNRYVVRDGARVYGAYRSVDMAIYRMQQIEDSRRPGRRWKRPENRKLA